MEGYLKKKKLSKRVRSYKIRFCRLVDHTLEYYNDANDNKCKGTMNLLEVDILYPKPSNALKLIIGSTFNKWQYVLQAGTEHERDAWLENLSVWTDVINPDAHIPIPPRVAEGILAAIEFCTFYARRVGAGSTCPYDKVVDQSDGWP